jgi:hypothetical protein
MFQQPAHPSQHYVIKNYNVIMVFLIQKLKLIYNITYHSGRVTADLEGQHLT